MILCRDDFERTGLSSLISVGVRDIQGEGFPDEFIGLTDSAFLDLPQPWLAIPSAARMLKQDGTLCSFSPCVEQVQRSCEALRTCFTGTFMFFFFPSSSIFSDFPYLCVLFFLFQAICATCNTFLIEFPMFMFCLCKRYKDIWGTLTHIRSSGRESGKLSWGWQWF